MRCDLFYQAHVGDALPLVLISQTEWNAGSHGLSDFERAFLSRQHFQGNSEDLCLITKPDGQPLKACIGSGDGNDVLAMAFAAGRLPSGSYVTDQKVSRFAQITWSLAQYRFDDYKKQVILPRILFLPKDILETVTASAAAIFLVRDLINRPTNDMGPKELSAVLANLAKEWEADFDEWVGDELLKANFPAIHMVGRASANSPRLLSLSWGDASHPRVTLVGKGVCFDSGGLDLKPALGMRLMKKDMGGAAHVVGLALWIMSQRLPVRLQVLIPAVENSVGPDSFRPGDILTMRNGMTVEIDNTDAEGRLVLADALVKAGEDSPELIIDFATLTGAARIALGTEIAAMFTNDESVARALMEASLEADDPVWRLPLFAPYQCMLDSGVADMANASPSSYAGGITAALFLQRFVPVKTSWVHFDIMAWNVSGKPGKPEGGEAMAIRAVAAYLQKKYKAC